MTHIHHTYADLKTLSDTLSYRIKQNTQAADTVEQEEVDKRSEDAENQDLLGNVAQTQPNDVFRAANRAEEMVVPDKDSLIVNHAEGNVTDYLIHIKKPSNILVEDLASIVDLADELGQMGLGDSEIPFINDSRNSGEATFEEDEARIEELMLLETTPLIESWLERDPDPEVAARVQSALLHKEAYNLQHGLNQAFQSLENGINRFRRHNLGGLNRNGSWINSDSILDLETDLMETIAWRMYLTPIDQPYRTMACLVRGRDEPCEFSMSGWTDQLYTYQEQGVIHRAKYTEEVLKLARTLGIVFPPPRYGINEQGQPGIWHACHAEAQLLAYQVLHDPKVKARAKALQEMKQRRTFERTTLLKFRDDIDSFEVYICQPYQESGGICNECVALCNEIALQLDLNIRLVFMGPSGVQIHHVDRQSLLSSATA